MKTLNSVLREGLHYFLTDSVKDIEFKPWLIDSLSSNLHSYCQREIKKAVDKNTVIEFVKSNINWRIEQ